jgi:hypothetical protein
MEFSFLIKVVHRLISITRPSVWTLGFSPVSVFTVTKSSVTVEALSEIVDVPGYCVMTPCTQVDGCKFFGGIYCQLNIRTSPYVTNVSACFNVHSPHYMFRP